MCAKRFTLLLFVFAIILIDSDEYQWRTDRLPLFMGDALNLHRLAPHHKNIQRKIVIYHNYFRSRVLPRSSNMLKMQWHWDAAYAAQKWADECMFLHHDNITGRYISNYGSCGQNIFVSSHLVPWLFAIKTWYLEKDNFTYGGINNDLNIIGHYTQMVWATTHQIGCGLTRCDRLGKQRGTVYYNYVCNYCPIGNKQYKLGFPYRRGKPCKSCENACFNKRLCTNSCPTADYWVNCKEMFRIWPNWLCHTESDKGRMRRSFCKATCTCIGKLFD